MPTTGRKRRVLLYRLESSLHSEPTPLEMIAVLLKNIGPIAAVHETLITQYSAGTDQRIYPLVIRPSMD